MSVHTLKKPQTNAPLRVISSLLIGVSYLRIYYYVFLLSVSPSLWITAPVGCLTTLKEQMTCQAFVPAQDHPIKRYA